MEGLTHAVILAAGRGSRLECAAGGRPKCLVEVGGRPLIEHQISSLRSAGIRRIFVVVGHGAEQVLPVVAQAGVCQFNRRYHETNSLYSLWLTRDWIDGPLVLMNCDVVADPGIVRRVAGSSGNALAYDSSTGFDDEQMKVAVSGGLVRDICKSLGPKRSDGENVGILKFDRTGARMLFEEAETLVRQGRENEWAPAAVRQVARRIGIRAIDVSGLPWTEIDFPEDLDHARHRVWPSIASESRDRGRDHAGGSLALPS